MEVLLCYDACDVPPPDSVLLAAVSRGQSGAGVHGRHPRRLPIGLPVSTNHEAASGGVQVQILLAGNFFFFFLKKIEIQWSKHDAKTSATLVVSPQIIILWNSEKPPPNRNKWPPMPVPLIVTDGRRKVSASDIVTNCRALLWSSVICSADGPWRRNLTVLVALADHQPVPTSRRHRDGSGAEPGRGHGPADQ